MTLKANDVTTMKSKLFPVISVCGRKYKHKLHLQLDCFGKPDIQESDKLSICNVSTSQLVVI